jgi:hypothetical protein
MKSTESRIYGKIVMSVVLSAVLLWGPISFTAISASRPDSGNGEKIRSMAESQHEIVVALLKKKEYENAAAEANKIFDMKWPESQEPLILKELLNLSDLFLRHGQAQLGLQLVNRNSKCCKQNSSQVEILKQTGYLYKSLNQNDKYLECFRKARELEKN